MGFIIGLLTFILVVDCMVLVFLVLIQLPKKDAGAGLAFGGAASDALFGAGSGNVLTKVTKYTAAIFFVLAIFLSFIQMRYRGGGMSEFQKKLMNQGANTAPGLPPAPSPGTRPATATTSGGTNVTVLSQPAESTNLPAPAAPPATNITSPPPSK